ncbi:AAA family ATPase [Tractidigestivibacter montrealensis]|uniref:Nuclease SbcCD subunit C n=1 Tax=Tractidigestivibacter montrealensis TaxID=2972466 RepID=A0ABT1ZB25_9ACTN|nr:AAA family ATPase [Tractidigestivibacter montrealensis]MCR9037416.1 AAA family ATPase [Tractidigestivibacter montrealensis]
MITRIDLPLRVPFDSEQTVIDHLNRVCFMFGPNGSGKTTVSRLIANESTSADPKYLHWDDGGAISTYVYNRDFIEQNFRHVDNVPGVFTIGKDSVEAQKAIDDLTAKIEKEEKSAKAAQANLDQSEADCEHLTGQLQEACWQIRRDLPGSFQPALKGTGKKSAFYDKVIKTLSSLQPDEPTPDAQELDQNATLVFDDTKTAVPQIPPVDFSDILTLEETPVLKKVIVGKEDLPITAIISELGNSDWVATGRHYIGEGPICPFCQQPTITKDFKTQLEQFFDRTYADDIETLHQTTNRYKSLTSEASSQIEGILNSYASFLSSDKLRASLEEFRRITQLNLSALADKGTNPSLPVTLGSCSDTCKEIASLLESAREKVGEHNRIVSNRASLRKTTTDSIWKYISLQAKPRIQPLQEQAEVLAKRINGLTSSVQKSEERISSWRANRDTAEKRITNVRETADTINDLLVRFGFTNFKLDVADDNKSYRIIRENGDLVENTLSEGESSFLAFLYFYNLMSGSQTTTGVSEKRVVVIDDPITSMDADVLFVTSSLVRRLAQQARSKEGPIDQLIVLTHNITFHKEITYSRAGDGESQTSYYFIRKRVGHSTIARCAKNPISSTYKLLWQELYSADCRPLTAQNVARRIVETFFKLMGGIDIDQLVSGMSSPDREVARSFLSWANAGSHSAFDDETFINTGATTESYRHVLESLFESTGYADHCHHMIQLAQQSQAST